MTAAVSSWVFFSKEHEADALQHAYVPNRMRRVRPRPCSFSKTVLPCLMSSSGPTRPKESTAAVNGEFHLFRCPLVWPQLTFDSTL
jgi:hypothetical protein